MREQLAATYFVLFGVCTAVGMVGLPVAAGLSSTLAIWGTALWLVLAIVVSLALLVLARPMSEWLALTVAGASPTGTPVEHRVVLPSQARLLSRLVIFGLALIVAQASLRRPTALLIGGQTSAASIEEGIAAAALAIVLALLVWTYESGRPVLQALTLRFIDAAIPTVNPPPLAEPTRTMSVVDTSPIPSPTDAPTLRAPKSDNGMHQPAVADEPTLRAPLADADPTLRVSSVPDETLRVARADEPTLPNGGDDEPTVFSPHRP